LDRSELAGVVQAFYRKEKVARTKRVVQKEVDASLDAFDVDGDGTLNYEEFVEMFSLSPAFQPQMPLKVRHQIRKIYLTTKGRNRTPTKAISSPPVSPKSTTKTRLRALVEEINSDRALDPQLRSDLGALVKKEEDASASMIQGGVRGCAVRRWARNMRVYTEFSAVVIQAAVKGCEVRIRVDDMLELVENAAASRIQGAIQGWDVRDDLLVDNQKAFSAQMLQGAARGTQARRIVKAKRSQTEGAAAVVIQGSECGCVARHRVCNLLETTENASTSRLQGGIRGCLVRLMDFETREETASVIVIQGAVVGCDTRNTVDSMLVLVENSSASVIQGTILGCEARHAVSESLEVQEQIAASRIQAVFQGLRLRIRDLTAQHQNESARVLQGAVRRYVIEHSQDLKIAAAKMQKAEGHRKKLKEKMLTKIRGKMPEKAFPSHSGLSKKLLKMEQAKMRLEIEAQKSGWSKRMLTARIAEAEEELLAGVPIDIATQQGLALKPVTMKKAITAATAALDEATRQQDEVGKEEDVVKGIKEGPEKTNRLAGLLGQMTVLQRAIIALNNAKEEVGSSRLEHEDRLILLSRSSLHEEGSSQHGALKELAIRVRKLNDEAKDVEEETATQAKAVEEQEAHMNQMAESSHKQLKQKALKVTIMKFAAKRKEAERLRQEHDETHDALLTAMDKMDSGQLCAEVAPTTVAPIPESTLLDSAALHCVQHLRR